jgi:hypothetical protein
MFETTRSPIFGRSMVINVVFALLILYMLANFLFLGFMLDKILLAAVPNGDPVGLLNSVLLYYLAAELFIRFFMQAMPALSITPFLHLPIKRSFILNFLLARSFINPANYISMAIFIPFAISTVSHYYSAWTACAWLLTIFLMIIFVILINTYIKRQMLVKPFVTAIFIGVYALLIFLEFFGVSSLTSLSSIFFETLLEKPLFVAVPLILTISVYLLNYQFLKANAYPEEIDRASRKKHISTQKFGFISRFGIIGELIGLELNLIMRHKRTKTILYTAAIFIFYGLLFYTNPLIGTGLRVFVAIFLTGFMAITYGQFIVGWDSKFFDGILTRNISTFDYFRAKYYLLVSFCVINYILATPYVYFGMDILLLQTACFLFNVGVNIPIILWFAQFNNKVDLSSGSMMNWQGIGASQFIVMLPVLMLPMLIISAFSMFGLIDWGLATLTFLGITGILFHRLVIQYICKIYSNVKYKQAERFRQ